VEQGLQMLQAVNGHGLFDALTRAEPQQAAVDDGLRQQMEVPLEPGFALCLTALWEAQFEVGAHDVCARTEYARCEPAQCPSPAQPRGGAAAAEVGKHGGEQAFFVELHVLPFMPPCRRLRAEAGRRPASCSGCSSIGIA